MFRNKLYSVLCAVLVLAFVVGCGSAPANVSQQLAATQVPTTPTLVPPTATPVVTDFVATKPEEIAGVWRFTAVGVPWFFNFYPDGKHFSNRVEGGKGLHGTFWFEGSVFHFKDIGCSPDDIQQTEGTYEAHVIQHDGVNFKLYFNAIEDSCKDRANEMKKGYYWKGPLE